MEAFLFFPLPFENNLLALARVVDQVYTSCTPACVDKYSSSVAVLLFFFLDEDLAHKCGWLTENTVDGKINELADVCY